MTTSPTKAAQPPITAHRAQAQKGKQMQVGQQVKGSYMGHQFAGVIESQRLLSVPTDGAFERFVKLTAPIVVFGLERSTLVMFTKYDGSPSSYTRYSESMEAA